MDNLTASVQALPPELFNQILDLTFTPDRTEPIVVECNKSSDTTYKPPKFLHVNRVTREHFAQGYYGDGSVFYILEGCVEKFFNGLPQQHASLIHDIRIVEKRCLSHLPLIYQQEDTAFLFGIHEYAWRNVIASGRLNMGYVRMKVVMDDGAWRWLKDDDLFGPLFEQRAFEWQQMASNA